MTARLNTLKTAFLMAALMGLSLLQAACSKDGSEKIWIDISPSRPVVINADYQIEDYTSVSSGGPPTYIQIPAPWIKFSYKLTNTNSDDPVDNTVTIVGINLYITAFTSLGVPVYGNLGYTAKNVAGSPQITPLFLAQAAPGQVIQAGNNGKGLFDPTASFAGDFYASSLPKDPGASTTSPSTATLTYQFQAVFVGWFGTVDDPKKRFSKIVSFTTQ